MNIINIKTIRYIKIFTLLRAPGNITVCKKGRIILLPHSSVM